MKMEKTNVKIAANELWYVMDILAEGDVKKECFDHIIDFDLLDSEREPESLITTFTHIFKQINHSSNKISIYYYTDLMIRINDRS